MSTKRPKEATIRKLFAMSMNQCAFEGCKTRLIDAESNTNVAEVCHIAAQNEGGPRYNFDQSEEERHSFSNLILMCGVHHKVIDSSENLQKFTVEYLIELKRLHEKKSKNILSSTYKISSKEIGIIQDRISIYEQGSTHIDLRNSVFNAGGEGGKFGGGGGNGGIIQLIGTKKIPKEIQIVLNGKAATDFGGGGGGGGAIEFISRPITSEDIEDGLKVTSCFAANYINFSSGLFNAQGAGWNYCSVQKIPTKINVNMLCIIEFGNVLPESFLRLDFQIINSNNMTVASSHCNFTIPEIPDLVPRLSIAHVLEINITELGVLEILVKSEDQILARYPLEIKS